jgi:hypothetical protein
MFSNDLSPAQTCGGDHQLSHHVPPGNELILLVNDYTTKSARNDNNFLNYFCNDLLPLSVPTSSGGYCGE